MLLANFSTITLCGLDKATEQLKRRTQSYQTAYETWRDDECGAENLPDIAWLSEALDAEVETSCMPLVARVLATNLKDTTSADKMCSALSMLCHKVVVERQMREELEGRKPKVAEFKALVKQVKILKDDISYLINQMRECHHEYERTGDGQSPDEIYQLPALPDIQAGLPSHHSGSATGSSGSSGSRELHRTRRVSEWMENAETEQDTETVGNVEHTSIPSYYHINPDGNREPFSPEDNRIIYRAQNQGLKSVAVAPVNIGEWVLNFEVRFGNNARSTKMPRPSPTGMCQVNLANQNTRVVEREEPKRRRETVETESSYAGSEASNESEDRVLPCAVSLRYCRRR
eukprot:COSAG02_NODE_1970_length_10224_cov_104.344691_6_plen_345_part_00